MASHPQTLRITNRVLRARLGKMVNVHMELLRPNLDLFAILDNRPGH